MTIVDLVLGAPPVVAIVVWVLIVASRAVRSGAAWPDGLLCLRRVVKGSVFGGVLLSIVAVGVIVSYRHEVRTNESIPSKAELGAAVLTVVVYLTVFPLAGLAGLRLLGARPAWLVTLGVWGLLGCWLLLVATVAGDLTPHFWAHGVAGLFACAIVGAVTVGGLPAIQREKTFPR